MNMVSFFKHHVNTRNSYEYILILEKDMENIMNKLKSQKTLWHLVAERMKTSPMFSEKKKVSYKFNLAQN